MLDAVVVDLPKEVSPPSRQNSLNVGVAASEKEPSSAAASPATALDVLVDILTNVEGKYPAELRANLCQLLGEVGRESLKAESKGRGEQVEAVRSATRATLESIRGSPDSFSLSAAARKALENWTG